MIKGPVITVQERNRQILEMCQDGMSQAEVARKFGLSPSRIYLIEKQSAASRSLAEKRTRLLKQLRDADEIAKLWPVGDLLNALGLIAVTRKRLMDHFVEKGQDQISLRVFMDMCLDAPVEGMD